MSNKKTKKHPIQKMQFVKQYFSNFINKKKKESNIFVNNFNLICNTSKNIFFKFNIQYTCNRITLYLAEITKEFFFKCLDCI